MLVISCTQTNHFRPHFRTTLKSLTNYGAATKSAIRKFLYMLNQHIIEKMDGIFGQLGKI